MTVTPSSILVPSGLAKVHPQLETCIKSIKSAVSALNGSVTASSSQTNNTATLASQLQTLQAEVAALEGAVGATSPQPVYRAGAAISAYTGIYAISSGIAGIASSTAAASSTALIGVATATAASGSMVSYAGPGETVTNPAWSFSVGPVFLGSAGALTQTIPTGSFPVQVGSAVSATVVLVDIQGPFVPLLNTSVDPSAIALYVNSSDGTLRYYNGSAWVHLGTLAGTSCAYATVAALPANTYSDGNASVGATLTATADGAISVDSVAVTAGQRILVKNEATSANNGIYWVTQAGSTSTPYILTRASDANEANQLGPGIVVPVKAPTGITAGTVNDGLLFLSAAPLPFVVGSSAISFTGVGLAAIANLSLLANISGSAAKPGATTLTALLDAVFGATQGAIIYRGASAWGELTPGTAGQILETQGSTANPQWAGLSALLDTAFGTTQGSILYRGASTWTELAPGTSGQFLETQGASANPQWATVNSLPTIANNDLLANTSGSSAQPIGTTLTALLDAVLGETQGAVIYRGGSSWAELSPGTSGQALVTGGASANPSWAVPMLGTIANNSLLANISGSTAAPAATTLTAFLDSVFGATQGAIIYRGASAWTELAPGTSGQFLQTSGGSANPLWAASGVGSGTALLAAATVRGSTNSGYSTNSTTPVALDSTNLKITFIAPSSGTVLIRQQAYAVTSASGSTAYTMFWCLLNGSGSLVANTTNAITDLGTYLNRYSSEYLLTGLTPGTSYTYEWGWYVSSAGSGSAYLGYGPTNGSVDFIAYAIGPSSTTKNVVVPITGFSNTIPSATTPFINYILNPAGTLSTGTITLPATPIDGQMVILSSDQIITALTLSANAGQSIKGAVSTLSAGPLGTVCYVYDLPSTSWYPA